MACAYGCMGDVSAARAKRREEIKEWQRQQVAFDMATYEERYPELAERKKASKTTPDSK